MKKMEWVQDRACEFEFVAIAGESFLATLHEQKTSTVMPQERVAVSTRPVERSSTGSSVAARTARGCARPRQSQDAACTADTALA